MIKRTMTLAVAVALVWVLAGCGSSGGSDSSSGGGSSTTAAPAAGGSSGTSSPSKSSGGSGGSGCNAKDGKDGIVRTFCDGPATVSFTVGNKSGQVTGGTCALGGGYFSVNAGTVIDATFKGTKPDYAGFLLPPDSGDFTSTAVTASITSNGETTVVRNVTGTHDTKSASFTGSDMVDPSKKVTVKVTC